MCLVGVSNLKEIDSQEGFVWFWLKLSFLKQCKEAEKCEEYHAILGTNISQTANRFFKFGM